jgi:hypothetical protein
MVHSNGSIATEQIPRSAPDGVPHSNSPFRRPAVPAFSRPEKSK